MDNAVDTTEQGPGQRSTEEVSEFLSKYNITINKKRMKSLVALSDDAYEAYKFGVICGICCKNMDIQLAMEYYIKIKNKHIIPSKDAYFMLLSLVAGLGEQGSGSGNIREFDPPSDEISAQIVFEDMLQNKIPLQESSYTAMIRCYSHHNRLCEAIELYHQMTKISKITPKLRTYSWILSALADSKDIINSFILYDEMMKVYNIIPSEKEYCSMLRVTIIHQDQRFYDILNQMKEDILIPSSQSWPLFEQWFKCPLIDYKVVESSVTDQGIVTLNDRKLLSIDLHDDTRLELLNQIESFALTRAYAKNMNLENLDNGSKRTSDTIDDSTIPHPISDKTDFYQITDHNKEINDSSTKQSRIWSMFQSWLDRHQFDIVLDGANIGYYKQNYLGAPTHVSYHQIQWILNELIRLGYHPLLILHQRHTTNQTISNEYQEMIHHWRINDMIYETPSGWNDDWFWMYSCVKLKCYIITNDEMRDHHFQMLSPRWFSRWKERNVVHFSFGNWIHKDDGLPSEGQTESSLKRIRSMTNDQKSYRQALFVFPRVYSYRIQIISQAIDSNDSHGIVSNEYYFPASDKDTWLCCVKQ